MRFQGVAVGGHADGQWLSSDSPTTVGRELIPFDAQAALQSLSKPMAIDSRVTVRQSTYVFKDVREGDDAVWMWVVSDWTTLQALKHLLSGHRYVG